MCVMKNFLPALITSLLFVIATTAFSQLEYGAFNATGSAYSVSSLTDYQSLGVNPANLGWKRNSNSFNLGFLELGASIYSEPLNKSQIFNDLFGNSDPFQNREERNEAIVNFSDARLWASQSLTLFGLSYQDDKIGGFAFTIREQLRWNSEFNARASEFLFEGYNAPYFDIDSIAPDGDTIGIASNPQLASELYYPTEMSHIFYTEYVFGYGRKLFEKENFAFYAGIDIKYLQGYGMVQYYNPSEAEVVGYQALCPGYGVEWNEPTPSAMSGNGLKTAGTGFGFDIGLSFLLYNKTKVAIALNDIGSIKWDGNVYEGSNADIRVMESKGLNSYDIFGESGGILSDNSNLGEWEGLADKKVELPMHMRVGAQHRIIDEVEVGVEWFQPLKKDVPGSYEKTIVSVGAKYDPADWVQLSAGGTFGGYAGFNLPFGVLFKPVNKETSTWEIGVATRDFISLFKSDDPTVSVAFGFLRFSFGGNQPPKVVTDADAFEKTDK